MRNFLNWLVFSAGFAVSSLTARPAWSAESGGLAQAPHQVTVECPDLKSELNAALEARVQLELLVHHSDAQILIACAQRRAFVEIRNSNGKSASESLLLEGEDLQDRILHAAVWLISTLDSAETGTAVAAAPKAEAKRSATAPPGEVQPTDPVTLPAATKPAWSWRLYAGGGAWLVSNAIALGPRLGFLLNHRNSFFIDGAWAVERGVFSSHNGESVSILETTLGVFWGIEKPRVALGAGVALNHFTTSSNDGALEVVGTKLPLALWSRLTWEFDLSRRLAVRLGPALSFSHERLEVKGQSSTIFAAAPVSLRLSAELLFNFD